MVEKDGLKFHEGLKLEIHVKINILLILFSLKNCLRTKIRKSVKILIYSIGIIFLLILLLTFKQRRQLLKY